MKRYTYFDAALDAVLVERVEEDGETFGEWLRTAAIMRLGTTDPRETRAPKRQSDHGYDGQPTVTRSVTFLEEDILDLEERALERKVKVSVLVREMVRVALGKPAVPPKVKRAPRDPALSSAIIIEEQVEQFNGMRNLRIAQEGKLERKWLEIWERIRANPEEFFPVNVCRVNLCRLSDLGLHRHPGKLLADYADAVEAGERT